MGYIATWCVVISCNTRQTGTLVRGNLALTSPDCQTGYIDTHLQMLWPPEFEIRTPHYSGQVLLS